MKSRYKIILALAVIVIIFTGLLKLYGYNNTFRLWNVETCRLPHFSDIRTVITGAEDLSKGGDLQVWGRLVSYPRVWQGLYFLGINQTHTTIVGIGFILLFLIGVCLFLPNASNTTIFMVLAVVVSPAVLLAVERANVDLLIFFLISVAIVAAQRSYILATLAVLAGFILKLFPIFAITILLKAKRSKFILYASVALVFAGGYVFLNYSDILLFSKYFPKQTNFTYGMNVLWMFLSTINVTLGIYAKALSYLLVVLSFIFGFFALLRNDNLLDQEENTINLSAFRAGASIFAVTFLLATNFHYKLMFIIFTIPQLILWAKHSSAGISFISKLTIAAVLSLLWHRVIIKILLSFSPYGYHIGLMLSEMSDWVVFFCFVYLLFWSMPAWVKEAMQKHIKICRTT